MEIMDVLHWLNQNHELATRDVVGNIIPMVLIPLATVTVAITSLAGIIAGWFGIKLHTEGPKQFLEVLLRKRVLLSMVVVNLLGIGAYKGYVYVKTLPSFLYTITRHSNQNALPSTMQYSESRLRNHQSIGAIAPVEFNFLNFKNEIKLKKGAFRSGLLSGNSLFYGVDDGHIYEIDKKDLSVKRKFYIGTQVTTRPIIYKQRMYSGEGNHDTHHARIYSFDLVTGKFINAFKTKGHTEGQPTIASHNGIDYLFLAAGSDGIYAIDPISMKEIWHKKDGHIDATVTVDNGAVFVGTGVEKGSARDRSYAVSYEFSTGKTLWKKELPLSNWMHPVVTKTDVCYVLGEIYFKSSVGLFYCLNKTTGEPNFAIPIDAPIASKPFYLNDNNEEYVYFGDFKGQLYGIDIKKKEKMWTYKTGTDATSYSLASVDYDPKRGILWFASLDNGLFALAPKTGKVVIHWTPERNKARWQDNYASVTIDGNSIFHMDIEGNLRKFEVE